MRSGLRAIAVAVAVGLAPWSIGYVAAQQPKPVDVPQKLQKARDVVQGFTDRLKSELSNALKSGGPARAIAFCQTMSPDLASALAQESNLEVLRTSLKLRNPENAPDPWEEDVLRKFQTAAGAGADLTRLEHYEVVETREGDRLFRYMRAIPMSEICLACHGTDVKQDVKAEIARLYPEDKAIGFKLGELRGAFSLVEIIGE